MLCEVSSIFNSFLHSVQRTLDSSDISNAHMSVDFSCLGTRMAQQFLNISYVCTCLQEMGSKGMPQRMNRGGPLNPCLLFYFFKYMLNRSRGDRTVFALPRKKPGFRPFYSDILLQQLVCRL